MGRLSEHDRQRLHEAADNFINMFDEEDDEVENIALDHFIIIGIADGVVNDKQVEVPVAYCSSRKLYIQRGLVEVMIDRFRAMEPSP